SSRSFQYEGRWEKVLAERCDLDVVWHSTFFRPIGYAMPSRVLAIALDEAGVRVAYQYLYGAGTVYPVDERKSVSSGNYRLEIIRRRTPRPGAPKIMFGQADAFRYVTGGFRIGYSMLETTGIPADWVQGCNEVDEVWVPTPFNAWTFRRSGVTKPVRVMPLGLIDTNYFNPDIVGHPIEGVFTFLSIFEWGERKAPEVLLRTFNKAFRRDEPVVLICKFVNSDPAVDPRAAIAALDLDPEGGRLLISENERVPYYQLPQFYRSADCFVLPTRGEGWGMPILEAMACGLPVIASHWSAQQHYMNDANSYPLQVGLVPAEAKCPYYTGFQWAEPDEVHLAERMRHVYEHRDEARAKGVRAAQDVEAFWSVGITARRIRSRLAEISGRAGSGGAAGVAQALRAQGHAASRGRVGIDVARAVGREVTGVGRYVVGLLCGLARLPREECPFDFLLMPGFDRFVHPEYLRGVSYTPPDDDRFTVYRGPLPAFGDDDRYVPGMDLVHCTGNSRPASLDVPSTFVVYDTTFVTHPQYHTDENIRFCMQNYVAAVRSDCHFIAISESTRRDFLRHFGAAEGRVSVAYCGVDPLEFAPRDAEAITLVRRKYGLPLRYFLCVGSLEPRKNVATAVRAMESYAGRETLVIVGASGWHNSRLHELIGHAHQRVLVLGYVDQNDLPAIYSGAVATVYPSYYEGFGLPVVESMACGTPVITSDNSSLAEIGQGAAILLEDPDDALALCRQFEELVEDANFAKNLRLQGLERAARFTPERCARATMEVFARLMSEAD
ncbi:MAG: glycosyltransferase, partial [Betaproteobacteria bacterium]